MGIYETHKEVIALTIRSKATADKKIDWNELIEELRTTIIDKYDESPLAKYKGTWKHAFRKIAKEIGITCKRGEDHWEEIIESHITAKYDQSVSGSSRKASIIPSSSGSSRKASITPSPSGSSRKASIIPSSSGSSRKASITPSPSGSSRKASIASSSSESQLSTRDTSSKASSTSSLNYQRNFTVADKLKLSDNFKRINKKWVLNSETVVEDQIYNMSKKFLYEHPSHSMIMDAKSPIWRSCFSAQDLDEVIAHSNSHNELNRPLPSNIQELLIKLNRKNTFRSIYDEFDAIKADPVENPEEYWIKRSIIDYACLFIDNDKILPRRTEQDLLEDVYGFIKKSYRLSSTTVETASASMSSGENKNEDRTIGSMNKVYRKQSADRADLVFKHLSHEIGCVEIGLEDEGANGTKEINERSIKTPIMMKNFAYHLVQQYKIDASNIITIGLIISGLNITGLLMTHDKGSISLIKSTERLHMPESVAEIARLLPPVLKLVYNCAKVMKETTNFLNDVTSSVALDNNKLAYFPPCFVAAEINHKKRKGSPCEE